MPTRKATPHAGKLLYATRCAACHSLEYNGVGPTHKGLIGRRAGTAQGYTYSNALKNSSVVVGGGNAVALAHRPGQVHPGPEDVRLDSRRQGARGHRRVPAAGRPAAAIHPSPTWRMK